jgi:hypothetical protein
MTGSSHGSGGARADSTHFIMMARRRGAAPRAAPAFLALALFPFSPLSCPPADARDATSDAANAPRPNDGPPPNGATIADPDDIVVTARYGEALVASETELGEQEIGNYGAGTIGELVYRIAPLIGRMDEQPIVLINGERVDSTGGIYSFPPEALERLAILPPEAAGRYGYSGRQRVVNLVLKKHFVSWQAEGGLTLPTAGGRHGRRLSGGRFVIEGKARWSAQAQVSRDTALLKSERASDRDETGPENPDAYRTLLPASRAVSFNAGVTRPIGRFSGSLNFNATRSRSLQFLGWQTSRTVRSQRAMTAIASFKVSSGLRAPACRRWLPVLSAAGARILSRAIRVRGRKARSIGWEAEQFWRIARVREGKISPSN